MKSLNSESLRGRGLVAVAAGAMMMVPSASAAAQVGSAEVAAEAAPAGNEEPAASESESTEVVEGAEEPSQEPAEATIELAPDTSQQIEKAGQLGFEVDVDSEIVEADELAKWVEQDGRRVLDQLPAEPEHSGAIRVRIEGRLYDYKVMVTAVPDGEGEVPSSEWRCECSNKELLERLTAALQEAAVELEVEETVVEPVEVKPTVPPPTGPKPPKRLGPVGVAAISGGAVGAVALATGITLMAVAKTGMDRPSVTLRYRDLRPAGGTLIGAGVWLLAAGVGLYVFRDSITIKRARFAGAITPSVDMQGHFALSATGRF